MTRERIHELTDEVRCIIDPTLDDEAGTGAKALADLVAFADGALMALEKAPAEDEMESTTAWAVACQRWRDTVRDVVLGKVAPATARR